MEACTGLAFVALKMLESMLAKPLYPYISVSPYESCLWDADPLFKLPMWPKPEAHGCCTGSVQGQPLV